MSKYTEPMKLIDFVEQFVAHNTVVEIYSLELVPEMIVGVPNHIDRTDLMGIVVEVPNK